MDKKITEFKQGLIQLKNKLKSKSGEDRRIFEKKIAYVEAKMDRYLELRKIQKRLDKIEDESVRLVRKLLDFGTERVNIHRCREALAIIEKTYIEKKEQYCLSKSKGDTKRADKANNDMQYLSTQKKEFRERLTASIRNIRKTAFRLLNEEKLTEAEKKLIREDKKAFNNVKRILVGIEKQRKDFKNGWHDLALKISKGDSRAVKQAKEQLDEFIRGRIRFYSRRLNLKNWNYDYGTKRPSDLYSDIEIAMFDASCKLEKNKYLSTLDWFKGKIKRALNELMVETFQRNEMETGLTEEHMEEFSRKRGGMVSAIIDEEVSALIKEKVWVREKGRSKNKPKFTADKKENKLWIEEVARRVGVTPQTLRNWDKSGLYLAKWRKDKGEPYRYYTEDDVLDLKRLKDARENPAKRRPKYTASKLKISEKTLTRWEAKGCIPQPKSDHRGRYYMEDDINIIAQMKNIKRK